MENAGIGFPGVGAQGRRGTKHGIATRTEVCKDVIVGRIEFESPEGKPAATQTIWVVDKGSDVARLVTAYPHKE
jgi:hypothetical protein